MICKFCGKPFERKHKRQRYCNYKCKSAKQWSVQREKAAEKHRKKEVKRQKLENERIKKQDMIFRFMITDLNSSPDAMRELAGLKPLQIKGAITYSELDGKEVSHIYENSELFNNT